MGRPRGLAYKVYECTCGHLQLAHLESEYGVEGHGGCIITGCPCIKFTWTSLYEIIYTKASIEKYEPSRYMFPVIDQPLIVQTTSTNPLYIFHRNIQKNDRAITGNKKTWQNMLKFFSDKCEHTNKCPFYNPETCDHYYSDGWQCGIKREVDGGATWIAISQTHHKKDEISKTEGEKSHE